MGFGWKSGCICVCVWAGGVVTMGWWGGFEERLCLEDIGTVLETRSVDDSCNRRLEQHETLNVKQR